MKIFAKVNRLGTKSLEIFQFCVKYNILCIVDFPKSNVDQGSLKLVLVQFLQFCYKTVAYLFPHHPRGKVYGAFILTWSPRRPTPLDKLKTLTYLHKLDGSGSLMSKSIVSAVLGSSGWSLNTSNSSSSAARGIHTCKSNSSSSDSSSDTSVTLSQDFPLQYAQIIEHFNPAFLHPQALPQLLVLHLQFTG